VPPASLAPGYPLRAHLSDKQDNHLLALHVLFTSSTMVTYGARQGAGQLWSAAATCRGRQIAKPLTGTRCSANGHTPDQSPRPKISHAYINCCINGYGRSRTSSDLKPKMSHDRGELSSSEEVRPPTTTHIDQTLGPSWGPPTSGRTENLRELLRSFSTPGAQFHSQSHGRCGLREESPRSTRASTRSSPSRT
jgi:hypothetical protein